MLDERKTRIVDINNKYVGNRVGTVRSNSFIPTPNTAKTVSGLPLPVGIGGSTITRIGPVTTLGRIPSIAPVGTTVISTDNTPAINRPIEHVENYTHDF
jgi:hypothetical protein